VLSPQTINLFLLSQNSLMIARNQCQAGFTNDGMANMATGIQTLSQAIMSGFLDMDIDLAAVKADVDALKTKPSLTAAHLPNGLQPGLPIRR
jgi:hypothetical protein